MASKDRKGEVTDYVTGSITITVGFPKDDVSCRWCPFCVNDPWLKGRQRCLDTNGIIVSLADIREDCQMNFQFDD